MQKSILIKSAFALVTAALLVPAFTDNAHAAKKKAAKLECIAYELYPTDTGSSKGDCVKYKNASAKAKEVEKKA